MPKTVYAIWLGDSWFTSGSEFCLQKKVGALPDTVFTDPDAAVAVYHNQVDGGIIIHNPKNAVVSIKIERV